MIVHPAVLLNFQNPGDLEREYISRGARPFVNGREIKCAWLIDSAAGIVKTYDVIGDGKPHSFVEALIVDLDTSLPTEILARRRALRELMEELRIRDLGPNERLMAMANPARGVRTDIELVDPTWAKKEKDLSPGLSKAEIEMKKNRTVWSRTIRGTVEIVGRSGSLLDLL
jgi:hypothetical protein